MEWAYWVWAAAVTVSAAAASVRITRLEKEVKQLQRKSGNSGCITEKVHCLQGNPRGRTTARETTLEDR